jgi:hypothetical protein
MSLKASKAVKIKKLSKNFNFWKVEKKMNEIFSESLLFLKPLNLVGFTDFQLLKEEMKFACSSFCISFFIESIML